MRVKTKLTLNSTVAIATICLLAGISLFSVDRLNSLYAEAGNRAKDRVRITEGTLMTDKFYSLVGEAVINRNVEETERSWTALRQELKEDSKAWQEIADTPAEKEHTSAAAKDFDELINLFEAKLLPLLKLPGTLDMEAVKQIDQQIDTVRHRASQHLEAVSKAIDAEAAASDAQFVTTGRFSHWLSLITGVAALAALIGLGIWLFNAVMRPLGALQATLADIAQGEGDLTVRLDESSRDEMGNIAGSFNQFVQKLQGVIRQVAESAHNLTSSARELDNASNRIASGAEELAAQSGTVATASEEMAATSNDIANSCHQAAESAQHAAETTQSGFEQVKTTVAGIRVRGEQTRENAAIVASLGERSDQIGAIVSTIEDIADQTNLLALNAAIEAARAGDLGRGFAVVADEVRALAERTTTATKEIGEMIRSIQSETRRAISSMDEGVLGTEQGAQEAAQLEQALQSILEQVNSVTMQVSQIATAAEEQNAVTGEITNNIQQITEVVQVTSQGAADTATTARSLTDDAETLRHLVAQFRLEAPHQQQGDVVTQRRTTSAPFGMGHALRAA